MKATSTITALAAVAVLGLECPAQSDCRALSFDGVDDYVRVPYSTAFPSSTYTITFWARIPPTTQLSSIISRGSQYQASQPSCSNPFVTPTPWSVFVLPSGELYLVYENDCGSDARFLSGLTVADDAWHFCALTRDAAGNVTIMVDQQVYTASNTLPPTSLNSLDLLLGAQLIGQSIGGEIPRRFLNGTLDEVTLWNQALPQSALTQIRDTGQVPPGMSLLAHWRLDEQAGPFALDAAGTNHGTLGASPAVDPSDPTRAPGAPTFPGSCAGSPGAGLQVRETEDNTGVRLDRTIYELGSDLNVQVVFPDGYVPTNPMVVVVAPGTADVEVVPVAPRVPPSTETPFTLSGYHTIQGLRVIDPLTSPAPLDGNIEVAEGGKIYALYYAQNTGAIGADVLSDFAFRDWDASATAPVAVLSELADLMDGQPGNGRTSGVLLRRNSYPVQIMVGEVILNANETELARFVSSTGAQVLGETPPDPLIQETRGYYLLRLPIEREDLSDLPQIREVFGESSELWGSDDGVLKTYLAVLRYQLDGYRISLDVRLQAFGKPDVLDDVNETMQLAGSRGSSGCVPGGPTPCFRSVPAVWAYMDLWNLTNRKIDVAILDHGYAPNEDFRRPAGGVWYECDMGFDRSPRCGPGRARGVPTVGNSLFGKKSWHGTGVVTTIGGRVNNAFGVTGIPNGAAGVGGQVAVPMLFKYGLLEYAFKIGQGIRRATREGASCINISGGYPCRAVLSAGPDFNYCDTAGRAALCAAITGGLVASVVIVCSVVGWIPVLGQLACSAVIAGSVITTGACVGSLAFGDSRGPIQGAVLYARARGVPVIASAGNTTDRSRLPPIIRDLVDTTEARADRWAVVPAVLRHVIAVGAVDLLFQNTEFYGSAVDIWAPTGSKYFAPQSTQNPSSQVVENTIGATSGAAPYVTGLIACMQAANPDLDGTNPALTRAQREAIVDTLIPALLTDPQNSFDEGEITGLGGYPSDPRRRVVVDPLSAIQAATVGIVPDLAGLGYDRSLNFGTDEPGNDLESNARLVSFGSERTGTILTLDREDGLPFVSDVDWFRFSAPSPPGRTRLYRADITLRTAIAADDLVLRRAAGRRLPIRVSTGGSGPEFIESYELAVDPGEDVRLQVGAQSGQGDNVYKLGVAGLQPLDVAGAIVNPGGAVRAGPVGFEATAGYSRWPSIPVADADIAWRINGSVLATGRMATVNLAAGTYDIDLLVFGEVVDSRRGVVAGPCLGPCPTVTITQPAMNSGRNDPQYAWDGFNSGLGLWFKNLQLRCTVQDNQSIPDSNIVWTTDRVDLQPALLGTGRVLSTTFYGRQATGELHRITVTVTDQDGNVVSQSRLIWFWTLI